ncbi:hypothetical protein HAX54_005941 [Datura stramonium]|uniref:Uncharacterized protein n=1 Tax=Datura stramonium TaxID=4076 RepID=A0ABS8WVR6_DATST|nr:hypothetical protein [Datura stramonium]
MHLSIDLAYKYTPDQPPLSFSPFLAANSRTSRKPPQPPLTLHSLSPLSRRNPHTPLRRFVFRRNQTTADQISVCLSPSPENPGRKPPKPVRSEQFSNQTLAAAPELLPISPSSSPHRRPNLPTTPQHPDLRLFFPLARKPHFPSFPAKSINSKTSPFFLFYHPRLS